jgi:hypothetical protein
VDPGHKFWFSGKNADEIKAEAVDFDRSEAEERLLKL